MKVRDVRKLIEADGWYYIGSTESHHNLKHATKKGKVTIPGKESDDIHPKTLASVLSQAQIERK